MEVLTVLAGLSLIVIFCVMILGLINPKLIKHPNNPSKVFKRKQILIGGIIGIVISIIIGVITVPDQSAQTRNVEQKNEEKVETPKATVIPEVSQEPLQPIEKVSAQSNLGMTPEQFRKAFNKRLKDLDIDTIRSVGEFNIKKGEGTDIFQVSFSSDINLSGTVNQDGMLRGLTFIIMPGEEHEKTLMQALTLIGISANILSGVENRDKTGKIVIDLVDKALTGFEKEKNAHSEVLGNIKYFATASTLTGLWFIIEPAKID